MGSDKKDLLVLPKKSESSFGRRTSGIHEFDDLLDGGFPNHCGIKLIGPPGCGKSTFCKQFIWGGLKNGEYGLYISFDQAPEEIKESMRAFGWDTRPYEEEDMFAIVDCFNGALGIKTGEKYYVENPLDWNEFMYVVNKCVNEEASQLAPNTKIRVVLDSVSATASMQGLPMLFKVGKLFYSYVRKYNVVAIAVFHKGALNKLMETFIGQMLDGSIEVDKKIQNGRINYYLWIDRMKGTAHSRNVHMFTVKKDGIHIIRSKTLPK